MDEPENALENLDVALIHSFEEVRREAAHDMGVGTPEFHKCLRVLQCPIWPQAEQLHHAVQVSLLDCHRGALMAHSTAKLHFSAMAHRRCKGASGRTCRNRQRCTCALQRPHEGGSNTVGRWSHFFKVFRWWGNCSGAVLHSCWAASQHQQILVLHTAGRQGGTAEQVVKVFNS